jgi:lysophospholipase L1-like esterase
VRLKLKVQKWGVRSDVDPEQEGSENEGHRRGAAGRCPCGVGHTLQNTRRNSRAAQLNATIPGIVDAMRAAGKGLVYVDMYNAVSTADLYDGIHSNSNGYDTMAAAWYQALASIVPLLSPQ